MIQFERVEINEEITPSVINDFIESALKIKRRYCDSTDLVT